MNEPKFNVQRMLSLEPFVSDHNLKFISYLLAYRYRRGRARNAATRYGAGTLADPSYISAADRDLYERYHNLIKTMEREEKSTELYTELTDKRLQAELVIENLREPERLDYDQRRNLLLELNGLEDDITRITGLLEDLNA